VYKESMLYIGIFQCHYKIADEDVHKFSNGSHMFMYMETWIWFGQRLKWPWKEEMAIGHAMYKIEHGQNPYGTNKRCVTCSQSTIWGTII